MEKHLGNHFYDSDEVFETYISHRKKANNPNELIEKPIVLELLEDVQGKVLDLGCGYGDIAEKVLQSGASQYIGVDASAKMIDHGKELWRHIPQIQLFQSSLEDWEYGAVKYDWVISRLVLHYLSNLETVFQQIHSALKPQGQFLFSVEHPVRTSSMHLPQQKGKKTSWMVDQYFELGPRDQPWMGSHVVKHHRSLEAYWNLINKAGFQVTSIHEGCPQKVHFTDEAEYERRKRIPLFLIMRATKLK